MNDQFANSFEEAGTQQKVADLQQGMKCACVCVLT